MIAGSIVDIMIVGEIEGKMKGAFEASFFVGKFLNSYISKPIKLIFRKHEGTKRETNKNSMGRYKKANTGKAIVSLPSGNFFR